MFYIAYGEMHEYLAWKRKASLNSLDNGFHSLWYYLEILKMFCLNLYYLVWGPIVPCVQTALEEARPNI